jgi:Protein of unknown function (DUF4013)
MQGSMFARQVAVDRSAWRGIASLTSRETCMSTPLPPVPPPPRTTIDFVRCFTFVTEDPAWVAKILIGGAFTLASTFLVGLFFVAGYWSRLLRRVAAGEAYPLPDWDDLGGIFKDGLPIVGLYVVYGLAAAVVVGIPTAVVFAFMAATGALSGHSPEVSHVLEWLGAAGFLVLYGVFALLALVANLFLPAILARAAYFNSFRDGFAWPQIVAFLRANLANYALALLAYLVASFASQFGVILCCVGIFPAVFWAYLILAYGLGDTLRLNPAPA